MKNQHRDYVGKTRKILTLSNLTTGKTYKYKQIKANGSLKGLVKKGDIIKMDLDDGDIEFSKIESIKTKDGISTANLDVFVDNLDVMKAVQEQKDAVAKPRRKRN